MLLTKAPNQTKFCHNRLIHKGDIHDQMYVFQKKWAKIHQNHLRPITPYGETTLEKSITKFFTPFNILVSQGDPLGQRSLVWVVGYNNPS